MKTKLLDQGAQRGDRFHWSRSAILAVAVIALSLTVFVEGLTAQGIVGRISGTVTDSQAPRSLARRSQSLTRIPSLQGRRRPMPTGTMSPAICLSAPTA